MKTDDIIYIIELRERWAYGISNRFMRRRRILPEGTGTNVKPVFGRKSGLF